MTTNNVGTQLLIAGATAAVTTTIAVFITSWLTKKSTTADIASGKDPLPPGSTPKTDGPPINVVPTGNPLPPPPAPKPVSLVDMANQIVQGVSTQAVIPKCPPGYHSVATGQPNFPYMCIAD